MTNTYMQLFVSTYRYFALSVIRPFRVWWWSRFKLILLQRGVVRRYSVFPCSRPATRKWIGRQIPGLGSQDTLRLAGHRRCDTGGPADSTEISC
jgi:hypothetical protein